MNNVSIIFLVVCTTFIMTVNRPFAAVMLLIGSCYMTLNQGIELGPFNFTILRILIAFGIIRIILKNEWKHLNLNRMDILVIFFVCLLILSSIFHKDYFDSFV